MDVPFHTPQITGDEIHYLQQVLNSAHWAANGRMSARCAETLETLLEVPYVRITNSATAALEMAFIAIGVGPGDEVIVPSWTFSSTANAVARTGATPVFCDIDDTLTLDAEFAEKLITKKTKAIVPVHYAGVCCDMISIFNLALDNNLWVIEDASQAFLSRHHGVLAGSLGDMAAFSFNSTKHIAAGEAGAFVIPKYVGRSFQPESVIKRADVAWMKGTNALSYRSEGKNLYEWCGIGSAFGASEITSAVLRAQLDFAQAITQRCLNRWHQYDVMLAHSWNAGNHRYLQPKIPDDCTHNGFSYYLLLEDMARRDELIAYLAKNNIGAAAHYAPLHTSCAGQALGKTSIPCIKTEYVAASIIRLPIRITESQCNYVCDTLLKWPGFSD